MSEACTLGDCTPAERWELRPEEKNVEIEWRAKGRGHEGCRRRKALASADSKSNVV